MAPGTPERSANGSRKVHQNLHLKHGQGEDRINWLLKGHSIKISGLPDLFLQRPQIQKYANGWVSLGSWFKKLSKVTYFSNQWRERTSLKFECCLRVNKNSCSAKLKYIAIKLSMIERRLIMTHESGWSLFVYKHKTMLLIWINFTRFSKYPLTDAPAPAYKTLHFTLISTAFASILPSEDHQKWNEVISVYSINILHRMFTGEKGKIFVWRFLGPRLVLCLGTFGGSGTVGVCDNSWRYIPWWAGRFGVAAFCAGTFCRSSLRTYLMGNRAQLQLAIFWYRKNSLLHIMLQP